MHSVGELTPRADRLSRASQRLRLPELVQIRPANQPHRPIPFALERGYLIFVEQPCKASSD